ncbi:MAG: hypothetical protein DRP64_03545 [Verrucomicrobia bacterium]|nr:MAG: hypothetical protein DRP64_03545 [Verrucomicrobiota bacterium]
MTIQVPWKIRLRRGHQASARSSGWWNRKKFHTDSGAENSPKILHEADLDHLGKLHKSSREG